MSILPTLRTNQFPKALSRVGITAFNSGLAIALKYGTHLGRTNLRAGFTRGLPLPRLAPQHLGGQEVLPGTAPDRSVGGQIGTGPDRGRGSSRHPHVEY